MIRSDAGEQATFHYLHGSCPQLAGAIAEATGWDLVIVTDDDGESGHVLIALPDGRYLDIRGIHETDGELLSHYGDKAIILSTTSKRLWADGWDITTWRDEDVDAASALFTSLGLATPYGEDDWDDAYRYAC